MIRWSVAAAGEIRIPARRIPSGSRSKSYERFSRGDAVSPGNREVDRKRNRRRCVNREGCADFLQGIGVEDALHVGEPFVRKIDPEERNLKITGSFS